MRKQFLKSVIITACALSLTACGFLDKDNTPDPTPLKQIKTEIKPRKLWSARTSGGSGKEYLKMGPAVGDTAIYTAGANGIVTSIDRASGSRNWQMNTHLPLTATPGIGDQVVAVVSRRGDIMALDQGTGASRWKINIPGEILASPAVGNGKVIVKSVDGFVRAFSSQDGHELWSFQQTEPSMILRGSSTPLLQDGHVFVGFANGNLVNLTQANGQLQWTQPIAYSEGAFAIQRMIDIDADPVLNGHDVYAATYQGKIASLDWHSGEIRWSNDISSYTGMVADNNAAYISDAKSHIWAFRADNGATKWQQTDLEARIVTAPADLGNYVVVGDAEGYLHWLDKRDGRFVAREYVGAMYGAPVVKNNELYALTNKGYLVAYTLS